MQTLEADRPLWAAFGTNPAKPGFGETPQMPDSELLRPALEIYDVGVDRNLDAARLAEADAAAKSCITTAGVRTKVNKSLSAARF